MVSSRKHPFIDLSVSESTDPGVCNHKVDHNNVITLVTFKKPPPGSTKVKFVFNKPGTDNNAYLYR